MPVSGKELATLDFASLIGGPLNAVVEAQAKSALATVNFIKETSFDKDGNLINVDFKYNREGEEFSLTVPFLTLLPVPYITIDEAEIEFNAKITSTNESKMDDVLNSEVNTEARSWWSSAKLQSKTSYQRKTTASEKEERTFDMHVRVLAANQEIPAGTERLLTILEGSIEEKKGDITEIRGLKITQIESDNTSIMLDGPDKEFIKPGAEIEFEGNSVKGKVATANEGNIVMASSVTGLTIGTSVLVKNSKTLSVDNPELNNRITLKKKISDKDKVSTSAIIE